MKDPKEPEASATPGSRPPVHVPPAELANGAPAGSGASAPNSVNRRVVLIDEDPEDRALIRNLLARQHRAYTVVESDSGEAGLEAIRSSMPDCVLVDFTLADMDGIEFLDALRLENDGDLPLPVAILTGEERDDVAAAALKRGAQDYLVKDAITGPALMRSIENSIEKFRIQGELVQSQIDLTLRNRKLEHLRQELEQKVSELANATRAKDQFMAVMSHEMRTPLNAIIGYADLLDMELDGELTRGQREQVHRIQVGSRHLLDLINDVLDLARADANKLEIDLRPVTLSAVLDEVLALLESQAAAKGLELRVEQCGNGIPLVEADLNRLRQVLTNLVGNAVKFTESGGVTVRCETDGGAVLVHVTDTGIGIDPDVLPLVFNEFYQARGELTREKGGTGLGLAISQRLARLMGGEIRAESIPGEGSTFTLELRASRAGSAPRPDDLARHEARMELQTAISPEPSLEPAVSVVALSDRVDSMTELEHQVHPGVRLAWTTRAADLLDLAIRHEAALIVLDASCLDDAAWAAVHSLQERPELSETAILLLPSIPEVSGEPGLVGLDLGWLSLVPKPFTAAQLRSAVATATRGADRTRGTEDGGRFAYDVLVVDDDPDSRRVAARFLSSEALDVREAPDGETALVEMRRQRPDVVVLDLMMPVLDGFGVLATMRADVELASVPVVVLTAKSLTEAERRFLSRSTVRVLQKGEHRLADVAALVLRAAARAV